MRKKRMGEMRLQHGGKLDPVLICQFLLRELFQEPAGQQRDHNGS
jgi:hypothetical protein